MAWLYLCVGVAVATGANYYLKISDGMQHIRYTIFAFLLYAAALWFYGIAIKTIPLTVAYVVWTGLGSVIIALLSLYYFNEKLSLLSVLFMAMILIGALGLHSISKE